MTRILVVGGDDARTTSVVRHLQSSGAFTIRLFARELHSAGARAMLRAGVEVVRGRLADRASLRSALRGMTTVFGVCCHEDDSERQERLGRNLINACAGADVEHVVMSDVTPALENYARSLDLPATFVRVTQTDAATFASTCLSGAIALDAIEDLGAVLLPIFSAPFEYIGRSLLVAVVSRPSVKYPASGPTPTESSTTMFLLPRPGPDHRPC